ncbi:MAG: hypothetical protein CMF59_11080 [Leptospiraceae bacterium]|nr:hypothetical protein [Leptospiraceae bacterium]|tara:strand:- start:615 stop:1088 length:474 start_codon:yes stop_codon:yes gene_type:complete
MQVRTNYGDDLKRTGSRKGQKASSTGTASEKKSSPFLDILNEVLPAENADAAELNRLWSDLPETEQKLLNHPSQENLLYYKELVRRILSATLRLNTRVEHVHRKGKGTGEKVELRYVRILDERIDQMAGLIRSKRNAAFGLLKALEGVRGILLDLRR